MPAPVPPGMMSAMGGTSMAQMMAGLPSMMTTEEQFDDTAEQLQTWMRDRILVDANLESKTDDEAVYLLHPEVTCQALPKDEDPPGTVPPVSQHCVDQLTKVPVRVLLRADGDGVRLTVVVGPDWLELSSFVVHSDLLAVEMDLPRSYKAAQYVDQALGTDSPMDTTRFETLAGRMRLSLHKDADKKVTFAESVLEAVHIATVDASGALGPDVKVGASDPTVAVTADGVAQALTVKLATGAIEELGTWDPKGGGPANRDLRVAIGSITGQTTFTEGDDRLMAKGLGIGPVSVDVRDARVFELGLNLADMNRFDLTVSMDAAGEPRFEVTPRFDLSLGFHVGLVASELSSAPPSYLLDETYDFRLEGGTPSAVAPVPATGTFSGGLKIGAGTLTLSSNRSAQPVVVPAGKCLTGGSMPAADAHPLLGKLAVVDCP